MRSAALKAREAISADIRIQAAAEMTDRFLQSIPLQKNDIVAGYWPVRGEIDVLPLLRALAERGHTCVLPCVVGKERPLIFREWHADSQMIEGFFGIAHPGPLSPIVVPHVLIVPMVGFDRQKHRLGYGAGYYDRTLALLKREGKALAVGVAYETQFLDDIPTGPHDHALDAIVTDKNFYQ
jgi:5-formyltetrahydrofolate cyclo-ligase